MLQDGVSTFQPMYFLNISERFGKEYIDFVEDVLRMITLQLIIQFMIFLHNPTMATLFNPAFFELLFYIILGVAFYHLIIRKIVRFV
jgi:hypothetical protein